MNLYNEITKLSKIKTQSFKAGEINSLLLTSKESIVAIGFILEEDLSVASSSNPMIFNHYLWGEKRLMNTINKLLPKDSNEEIIRWDGLVFFMNESLIFFSRIGHEFIDLKPEQDLINFYDALKVSFQDLKSPKEQMESEIVELGNEVDILNTQLTEISNKNEVLKIELDSVKQSSLKLENEYSSIGYENERLKEEISDFKKLVAYHESKIKKDIILKISQEQKAYLKNKASRVYPNNTSFNYNKSYLEIEANLFYPSILLAYEEPIFAEWEKAGDWMLCDVEKKYLIIHINGSAKEINNNEIISHQDFPGFVKEKNSSKTSIIGSIIFTKDEILRF